MAFTPAAVVWRVVWRKRFSKDVLIERLQAVADALKLRVRAVIAFEPLWRGGDDATPWSPKGKWET